MGKKLTKFASAALFSLGLMASAWADPAQVSITATPNPALTGSTLDVDVMISGVADLYAFQFSLSFDPSLLQSTGVSEGSFLAGGGATYGSNGDVDNSAGTISLMGYVLQGPVSGVTGDGVLMHLSFNAVGLGTATLGFSDPVFWNTAFNDIDVNLQPGNVVITAVPEPDALWMLGAGFGLLAWRRRQVLAGRS